MAQKVKLSTIAERLGLSTATVSLALRDSPLVAEVTRERIKEEARTSGYIYNRRAASLRTSKSGIVGVCVHDIMNPFYGEILKAVEDELDRQRQTFVLCNHYDDLSKQRSFLDTMLQLGADGLIMSPAIGTPASDIRLAEDNDLPVALIARTVEGSGVASFRGDDAYGMSLVVRHLIEEGHRSIALVGGTDQTSTGRDRAQGYRDALEEAGIEFGRTGGSRALARATRASTPPPNSSPCPARRAPWSAFSDLVALGLMYGLSRAGVRPGIDIAVCGYDDIDEAAIAMPPLTTVANGQAEVGHRAAGALLARLNGAPAEERLELIRPELRVRRSSLVRSDSALPID